MEPRQGNRAERNYFVVIFNDGDAVAVGKVKNIGKYGVFVRTDYLAKLRQRIDIQFVPKGQKFSERYRIKTTVVHKGTDGFGFEVVKGRSG